METNFRVQLQKNLLAIISVIIAIMALSYNSWRNERTEDNRNVRAAGFEIMREAAKLQFYVDATTYSQSANDVELIQGWVSINLIISLSELMSPKVMQKAEVVKSVWSSHWESLMKDEQANKNITQAINQLVEEVRQHLRQLS